MLSAPGMVPSSKRLLSGILDIARKLSTDIDDPGQREMAEVMAICIAELSKQQDLGFFADQLRNGQTLLNEGIALLRTLSLDAVADRIEGKSVQLIDNASSARTEDELGAALVAVASMLTAVITALPSSGHGASTNYMDRIGDWEVKCNEPASSFLKTETESRQSPEVSAALLQAYLRRKFPDCSDIEVTSFNRLPGGFSKITLLFDTNDSKHGKRSLVLRGERKATPFLMDGSQVINEYPTLAYAYSAGLPVARPRWLETDPAELGMSFLVTDRANGINYGSFLGSSRELSPAVIRSLVETLAKIHATKLDSRDDNIRNSHLQKGLRFATLTEFNRQYIEYWHDIAQGCGIAETPSLTRAFHWLRDHVPESDDAPCLVHGDFGLHNVLVETDKVSAVLDWEASHVGDPADEFFGFSMGMRRYASFEQLAGWYEEAGGKVISRRRLAFHKVLGLLKGPITGYGARMLTHLHPEANLKTATCGYLFVHPALSILNQVIAEAEAEFNEAVP